jgi:hypothetical protein
VIKVLCRYQLILAQQLMITYFLQGANSDKTIR